MAYQVNGSRVEWNPAASGEAERAGRAPLCYAQRFCDSMKTRFTFG